MGSDIKSVLGGIGHGFVDFFVGSIHDLQTASVYIGSAELEMSLYERTNMIEAVEQSQMHQMDALGSRLMDMMAIDESNSFYQSFRSKTTFGLEVGSMVAGGYGAVTGVIGFTKLARMPLGASKVLSKGLYGGKSSYQAKLLKTHLGQIEEYGASGYRQLSNGKIRYYGEMDPAKVK